MNQDGADEYLFQCHGFNGFDFGSRAFQDDRYLVVIPRMNSGPQAAEGRLQREARQIRCLPVLGGGEFDSGQTQTK